MADLEQLWSIPRWRPAPPDIAMRVDQTPACGLIITGEWIVLISHLSSNKTASAGVTCNRGFTCPPPVYPHRRNDHSTTAVPAAWETPRSPALRGVRLPGTLCDTWVEETPMGCCHYFEPTEHGANAFTVEMPRTTFGRGTLKEVGARARGRGISRAALFTDRNLADSVQVSTVHTSLGEAGVDAEVFSEVRIEPTDRSVLEAVEFLRQGSFDGVVSVGGGSVIDTAKAAMVYALYPASFEAYFAPPVGLGTPVPAPLLPHVACPTTCGTGSEATPLSVIRFEALNTKFVLVGRGLLPDEAVLDPACIDTLPSAVVRSSGFDLMSHAIECYTARAYTRWPHVDSPAARPPIQGANPWSDLHAREALRLVGEHLEPAVTDATRREARDALFWAATLAGMAFGNSGTHLPHALSYGVSQQASDFVATGYPGEPGFVPHGISVIVNSPSVFRFTAEAAPERHLEAAHFLGGDIDGAGPDDAGEVVAGRIISLMRATGVPNGLSGVGLSFGDAASLADSASRQKRAIGNAPRDTTIDDVRRIYEGAVAYW